MTELLYVSGYIIKLQTYVCVFNRVDKEVPADSKEAKDHSIQSSDSGNSSSSG